MAKSTINCHHCGRLCEKNIGHINRALRKGSKLFCGLKCSGLHRRSNKSKSQLKEEKREYDKRYREKNKEKIKADKADWFKRTYDPEKARIERKKRAHLHAEYCRRPEYRKWKKEYDRKYRAIKNYGEYWECFLLTQDIRDECLSQQTDYEIRLGNNTLNKTQRRKRNVRQTYGN